MGQNSLPGGIAARLAGLTAALISHTLAITALAADEARALIQRSLISVIIAIALIVSLFIAYLALVFAAIILLSVCFGWSWLAAILTAAGMHIIFATVLFIILRMRRSSPLFEATSAELRRDFEALNTFSRHSDSKSNVSNSSL